MLEAIEHGEANSFVTLTYKDERRDLEPYHLQTWLKRFRKEVKVPIRYFGVGEYGDISWRPHYHVALFGWPACTGGVKVNGECQCRSCSVVRTTWNFGHVLVGRLERKSAQYMSGYVTKKMTRADDPRLLDRHPEFSRMSLRPGIGANALHDVASEILRYKLEKNDVPAALRVGSSVMPIGRYLQRRLRSLVGRDEAAPVEVLQENSRRMCAVQAYAKVKGTGPRAVFAELFGPYEAWLQGQQKVKERLL